MELLRAQIQQELETPMRERFRNLDEVSNLRCLLCIYPHGIKVSMKSIIPLLQNPAIVPPFTQSLQWPLRLNRIGLPLPLLSPFLFPHWPTDVSLTLQNWCISLILFLVLIKKNYLILR